MKSANPSHAILATLEKSFAAMESARSARSVQERLAHRLRLAKSYAQLGLVDGTIDESISILEQDSTHVGALQLLAEAYDLKGRIAPAVSVLERLTRLTPDDAIAREKLQRLSKRM
jgi:lipopolysaccharide biosynthesis regulator YciM